VIKTQFFFFTTDHIFDKDVTNDTLFATVAKPLVVEALNGINATIFAYGQTSSGKTYTMTGNEMETGVIGLAVEEIFSLIEASLDRQFLLR
jgi:centromeric protein E